jgi:hypothetical protein
VSTSGGWRKVQVIGRLRQVLFPPRCINCAAEASRQLNVKQLFTSTDDDDDETWTVETIAVPVCHACSAKHQAELRPPSISDALWPAIRTEAALPMAFSSLTAFFFVAEMMKSVAKGHLRTAAILGIPVTLFGLIAYGCWIPVRDRLRRFRLPQPTTVTSSFTFSRDQSKLFEPPRRTFRFRMPEVAEAFIQVNSDTLWDPRSAMAASASTKRIILYGLLIFGFVLFLVGYSIKDWIM